MAYAGAAALLLRPAQLFSEDCINFAAALDRYDPRHLIPQPPGYPVFVLHSKAVYALGLTADTTFAIGVTAGAALSLWLLFLLAARMGGPYAGACAALLFAANPAFLFEIATSVIRVYVATVTLAVAYCCWRAWHGEKRYAWLAALALGAGSGYRPELLALLAPLLIVSVARGLRDFARIFAAFALCALAATAWLAYLLAHFESVEALYLVFRDYLRDQSVDNNVLYGSPLEGWVRMLSKVAVWNGYAIVGWVAFAGLARPAWPPRAFLALWILPSLLFQTLVHAGSPGHLLGVIAAFCLLGGLTFAALRQQSPALAPAALTFALTLNVLWFADPRMLYLTEPRDGVSGHLRHLRKTAFDAAWETGWRLIHDVDQDTRAALDAVRYLRAEYPEALLVWNRSPVNFRKVSHYAREGELCLVFETGETGNQPHAAFWQNLRPRRVLRGRPITIPLAGATHIIWMLGRDSNFYRELFHELRPQGGGGVYLSEAKEFTTAGVRFQR